MKTVVPFHLRRGHRSRTPGATDSTCSLDAIAAMALELADQQSENLKMMMQGIENLERTRETTHPPVKRSTDHGALQRLACEARTIEDMLKAARSRLQLLLQSTS